MIILLFILGILFGSFLNVVLFRMEREEDFVHGRSKCLSCGHTLAWYDNIPLLSFLLLRGQCRYCNTKISLQYPLIEFLTGLCFTGVLVVGSFLGGGSATFWFLVWGCISVAFSILIVTYDLRFMAIPVNFLWGICLTLLCYKIGEQLFLLPAPSLLPSISSFLWGGLISGAFFLLLVLISKETWMGMGDVWLGAWAGALVGIELVQVFITLSFSFGAIVGVSLLYKKQRHLKSEIPFAPYLIISAWCIVISKVFFVQFLQFLSPWFLGTI